MCTVTLVALRNGYRLGMNRDEQLTRARGLPPKQRSVKGRIVICPSEPSGGTWIALNDSGNTLALINWYSITARVRTMPLSRGEVVNAVGAATSASEVDDELAKLPLRRINPFRLIGVFPQARKVFEWRWDRNALTRKSHPWKTQQWASSGHDEPTAQRIRGQTFHRALRQKSSGTADWLRRLHRSHQPAPGPFSICMHRSDAATVSYTEVAVFPGAAGMSHCVGPPCHLQKLRKTRLRPVVE